MTPASAGSLRTVGIDDGYFPIEFKERRLKTLLVGIMCEGLRPVGVAISKVTVDGLDGTKSAAEIINELVRSKGSVDAIFIDGVTAAGFNIIDPRDLLDTLGIPVVVVFKHHLSLSKIKAALSKHFSDWESRYSVVEAVYNQSVRLITRWRRIRLSCYGMDCYGAANIISALQTASPLPEPLRLADIVASGLTKHGPLLRVINSE